MATDFTKVVRRAREDDGHIVITLERGMIVVRPDQITHWWARRSADRLVRKPDGIYYYKVSGNRVSGCCKRECEEFAASGDEAALMAIWAKEFPSE